MKLHWKILIWLVAGALLGCTFQLLLDAPATSGIEVVGRADPAGGPEQVVVARASAKSGLQPGALLTGLVFDRGTETEQTLQLIRAEDYASTIASRTNGDMVWHQLADGELVPVTLQISEDSPRMVWIRPFAFLAGMFLQLLKMLIVPIILTSIICGVVGVGSGRDLRRLGLKTIGYYVCTSVLAICTGLMLVNLIQPGVGAELGLAADSSFEETSQQSFLDVLQRMIPENVFGALSANMNMLQVIFFALIFGYFILRVEAHHQRIMKGFFESAFAVMMKLAEFVLGLIPYGIFCLLVKIVGTTGFAVFEPLLIYMATVVAALSFHFLITLPLILRLVGGVSPVRWFKAVSPALVTAFSTASSSMTLPVSMKAVEKRGRVSNRIVSFVQPLGATINMDGTALYECVAVIFLAQYYASVSNYELGIGAQFLVVFMALMASIGAAGIPSAGLIMMLTILSTLELPIEGAALLLAVDHPLDMMRSMVNVGSDTCGSAVIARSEGETGPLSAGEELPTEPPDDPTAPTD